jgi:hypothetical protein
MTLERRVRRPPPARARRPARRVARPRLFVHLAEADSFAARLRAFVDFCETRAAAFRLGGLTIPAPTVLFPVSSIAMNAPVHGPSRSDPRVATGEIPAATAAATSKAPGAPGRQRTKRVPQADPPYGTPRSSSEARTGDRTCLEGAAGCLPSVLTRRDPRRIDVVAAAPAEATRDRSHREGEPGDRGTARCPRVLTGERG